MALVDPVQSWIESSGLGVPLSAADTLNKALTQLGKDLVGTPIRSESLGEKMQHAVSRAIRIQMEMRMLPKDFERMDELAKALVAEIDGTGNVTVVVPDGWTEALDKMFHTYTCLRCGSVVPGVPHDLEDCDGALARDVMES